MLEQGKPVECFHDEGRYVSRFREITNKVMTLPGSYSRHGVHCTSICILLWFFICNRKTHL